MLGWALTCLIVALVAAILGFGGLAGASVALAKTIFFVAIVLFALSAVAHLVRGPVTRYEVPGIHAFNFVCEQALGGGGMKSLRNDALGKGMAQILLAMPVRIPVALLSPVRPVNGPTQGTDQ